MPQQNPWREVISSEATKQGVDPAIALAVADTESSFDPARTSPKGAKGLFQLMPDTAKRHGVNPDQPLENIRGGIGELRQLLDQHKGDLPTVLRRYNASPGAAETVTDPYVRSVMGKIGQYQSSAPAPLVGQPPSAALPDRRRFPHDPPPSAESFTRLTPMQKVARATPLTGSELVAAGKSAAHQFSPMTPGGRRNLAGAGAGAVTTALIPETGGLSAFAYPVIAAAVAGGGETAIEQAVGSRPPTDSPMAGALEQGAQEAGGHLIPWAAKAVARRGTAFVAQKVGTSALGKLLERLPEADAAGVAAREAIAGPGMTAKRLAGSAVEQAAETGPRVDLRPVKEGARAMVERATPPAESEVAGAGYVKNALTKVRGATSSGVSTSSGSSSSWQTYLATALQKAGVNLEPTHPLPGVLAKLNAAPDEVSFAEAHQLKRAIGEAINWDSPAKKQVQQITKGVWGDLREAMSGHAPYDEATAHYAAIEPLYTKEYAGKFRKAALTDPGSLVAGIQLGKKATPLRMLRDLLVGQSAEGGGAAEGQAAWDSVRGAIVRTKLIDGGFEKLDARLGKMSNDVQAIFFGDAHGRIVEENLRMIAAASKVARQRMTPEQELGHGARATFLGAGNLWGALSMAKLAMTGPQQRDLLEWAAYSPANTRRLVDLITGGSPTGEAGADLLRAAGIGQSSKPNPRSAQVGQPPPR